MLQKKKNLLLSVIKKNKIKGAINLGLRFYETKKKINKVHFFPTALQIEVTTSCNLKCKMCTNTYLKERGGNLDLDNFKKIIDSNPFIQKINFTGIGEALLNPNFTKMVEYAKKKGIYVWFSDNMTLMKQERIKKLLNAKVDLICVSLDGATKETFEKIRVGAKFEDVINNTKQLLQMRNKKSPLVGINMVISKENHKEIEDMVRLAHELRIDYLTFKTVNMGFKNIKSFSFDTVSNEKIEEILHKAKKTAEELGVRILSWPKTKRSVKSHCSMPWTNPYIAYNGDVFPCCFVLQELEGRNRDENIMGNIFKDDLKTIWNNEKYVSFRKRIKTDNPPSSCKICPNFYGLW